uniref:Uncharacterized protein n=1 Tax=Anguilla anguilla TaxID=7936 RepID=A0A0E9SL91_ANGAN
MFFIFSGKALEEVGALIGPLVLDFFVRVPGTRCR